MPKECLDDGVGSPWRAALPLLVGSSNVHNFTNTRAPRHTLTPLPFQLTDEEVVKLDEQQMQALHFQRDSTLNRQVHSLDVDELHVDSKAFWRFRIAGASFAYNQIRMVIGAILSVSSGLIPVDVLQAAFKGPFKVRIPVAPAGNLLLAYQHGHFFALILVYDGAKRFSLGTFPNWREGEGIDFLANWQNRCDAFKLRIYRQIASSSSSAEQFLAWMEEVSGLHKYSNQPFDNVVRRFEEWLPVYSNPDDWALRRRQALLNLWLPESRPLPPPVAPSPP